MSDPVLRDAAPTEAGARALLAASHALMQQMFPAESNHYLSVEALAGPDVRFFVVERDGQPLGCAALALRDGYGEVKSLFVAPEARGSGTGGLLMRALEEAARTARLPLIRLETGDTLDAARRLYARHGFVERGPFGDYAEDPRSVFMERVVPVTAGS
ncbi:MAG: GNAT family N-acetyltransferase [Celeribacter sp.]